MLISQSWNYALIFSYQRSFKVRSSNTEQLKIKEEEVKIGLNLDMNNERKNIDIEDGT